MINKDIINKFMGREQLTDEELDSIIVEVFRELNLDKVLSENKGDQYERDIFAAIANSGLGGLYDAPAGSDSSRADADIFLPLGDGNFVGPVPVEAKLNRKAQLGGSSFFVANTGEGGIKPVSEGEAFPDAEIKLLAESITGLLPDIIELKKYLKKYHEQQFANDPDKLARVNKTLNAFPFTCSVEAWQKIGSRGKLKYGDPVYNDPGDRVGLLKPLNVKIEAAVEVLSNLYKAKGVHYIQIGGSGLYIIGKEDPYGLAKIGVPRIPAALGEDGRYTIELRPGAGGSTSGFRGVGLRAQGRFKFTRGKSLPPSDYSIDTPGGVEKLAAAYRRAYPSGSHVDQGSVWTAEQKGAKSKNIDEEIIKALDQDDTAVEIEVKDVKITQLDPTQDTGDPGADEGFEDLKPFQSKY